MASREYPEILEAFLSRLGELYPSEAPRILKLCLDPRGELLGWNHPDLFIEALGIELDAKVLDNLRIGYVFLVGYYFLFDAMADGHMQMSDDSLYLPYLLSAAWSQFIKAGEGILTAQRMLEVVQLFSEYVVGNARAIRTEKTFFSAPLNVAEFEEFDSIVGRSNALLLLYTIMGVMINRSTDRHLELVIKKLAFYIQLSDDLGDWRDDYRAARFTSLLRWCFFKQQKLLTEVELEEAIFLNGIFEARAVAIIKGLEALRDDLRGISSTVHSLRGFVEKERDRVSQVLAAWLDSKLSALQ